MLPPPFSARSRVHEYGGGQFAVQGGRIAFVEDADQQIYLAAGGKPTQLTTLEAARFADMAFDAGRDRLISVVERPAPGLGGVTQNLVASVPLGGPRQGQVDDLLVGRDFYASPRPSPDGRRLAWLAWDLPHMPWEAAELWVGGFGADGGVTGARRIAGGGVFQPEWGKDGALYFVADRAGWGNPHIWRGGEVELIAPVDAEFSRPLWALGTTSYALLGGGRLIAAGWRDGLAELGVFDAGRRSYEPVPCGFTRVDDIAATAAEVAINGGDDVSPSAIHVLPVDAARLSPAPAPAGGSPLEAADISPTEVFEVPAPDRSGVVVRALYHRPLSGAYRGPPDAAPPMVVSAHGGPTAMARRGLVLERQYWTTRGFAYLDVDYRGSTGYGRTYRALLDGKWGLTDWQDVVAAAEHAGRAGLADPARLVVRGSSAGGLTVLNALIHSDIFAAGASHYGVADLERLAVDTHKFEAGYLVSLLGGLPAQVPDIYLARSPIHHAGRIAAPVIFLQGLDDRVVPPLQSRAMADSLRQRGVPVALIEFAGEAHGFRQPETVIRALQAEHAFFARILGLEPAETLPAIAIDNWEAAR
jgi:dipeptidyl aminopeptidase/acylaminoacyl peptidase